MNQPTSSPGIPAVHAAWILALCVAGGLVAGRAMPAGGGSAAAPKPPGTIAIPAGGSGTPASTSGGSAGEDLSALKKEADVLRARLAELEGKAAASPARSRRLSIARKLEAVARILAQGNSAPPDDIEIAITDYDVLMPQLDADLASYFLERASAEPTPTARARFISIALACGGPEVSAWMLKTLSAAANDPVRIDLLRIAAGPMENPAASLPVVPGWLEAADRLATSLTPEERVLAGDMIAALPPEQSRQKLQKRYTSETDGKIRARLLNALSDAGDSSTLEWLKTEVLPWLEASTDPADGLACVAAENAIGNIEKRLAK